MLAAVPSSNPELPPCPLCGGTLESSSRDTWCVDCGDKEIDVGSRWYDGRGIVEVLSSFPDRHGIPYCVVQHSRGNPRVVSQGLMLREWALR